MPQGGIEPHFILTLDSYIAITVAWHLPSGNHSQSSAPGLLTGFAGYGICCNHSCTTSGESFEQPILLGICLELS